MPAWIVITAEDLANYSVGEKITALRQEALDQNQGDPFTAVMPEVAAEARGYLSRGGQNQLSETANSVPPEAKRSFVWLVIQAMQTRLPGLSFSDEEKAAIEDAHRWFERVADGKIAISVPEDPVTPQVQAGGAIAVVSAPTRVFTSTALNGI